MVMIVTTTLFLLCIFAAYKTGYNEAKTEVFMAIGDACRWAGDAMEDGDTRMDGIIEFNRRIIMNLGKEPPV